MDLNKLDTLEKIVTEKHRVVVQLTKPPSREANRRRFNTIFHAPLRPERSDPYIAINPTCLQINPKRLHIGELLADHQTPPMHFDCVGNGFDISTRNEISDLMDRVFLQHRNACMMRFTATRENSLALLNHLLVVETNKRLQMHHFSLQGIKLEFSEIRKFDVLNLFGLDENDIRFQSTMDLQRWLNLGYQHLVNGMQGHKCMDFQFSYTDRRHQAYSVRFSYLHIVMGRLDNEGRALLRYFFENVDKKHRSTNSILIDTIRDYLAPQNDTKIWMFFDVPLYKPPNVLMEELVGLASAAYYGFENMYMGKKTTTNNNAMTSDMELEMLLPYNTSILSNSAEYLRTLETYVAQGGVPYPSNVSTRHPTNKDKHGLNFWYTKIDEQFAKVLNAMEAYYTSKYDVRITKLCDDIRDMVGLNEFDSNNYEMSMAELDNTVVTNNTNTINTTNTTTTNNNNNNNNNLDDEQHQNLMARHTETLQNNLLEYRNAISAFRKLVDDISQTKSSDALKVYIRYKNYELLQHGMDFKIRKLNECQKAVSKKITDELEGLKSVQQPLKSNAPQPCKRKV